MEYKLGAYIPNSHQNYLWVWAHKRVWKINKCTQNHSKIDQHKNIRAVTSLSSLSLVDFTRRFFKTKRMLSPERSLGESIRKTWLNESLDLWGSILLIFPEWLLFHQMIVSWENNTRENNTRLFFKISLKIIKLL